MNNYIASAVSHYCNICVEKCSSMRSKVIGFYDLTIVLQGSMTYIADDKTYRLKKNDALFLRPGTVRARLEGTEPVSYVSFNFQVYPECEPELPSYLCGCVTAEIRKLLSVFPQQHLSVYYHSGQKVANMLNYILFELENVLSLRSSNEHIMHITKYIGEHITKDLNLAVVSNAMGLSREYVSYLFRKETGQTLTDYINSQKMLLAKGLIQDGEMSLLEIASHLGYNSYSYFSRVFKRYFETSPTNLRNQCE